MRGLLALVLAIALSGCAAIDKLVGSKPAHSPKATARAETKPDVVPPKPKRSTRAGHDEKVPERFVSIGPEKLIGLDPSAVERLIGPPSEKHEGAPSLVWVYSNSACSLLVYFFPDVKTGTLHALKYGGVDRSGVPINISHECIRNILVVKTNGTG